MRNSSSDRGGRSAVVFPIASVMVVAFLERLVL